MYSRYQNLINDGEICKILINHYKVLSLHGGDKSNFMEILLQNVSNL